MHRAVWQESTGGSNGYLKQLENVKTSKMNLNFLILLSKAYVIAQALYMKHSMKLGLKLLLTQQLTSVVRAWLRKCRCGSGLQKCMVFICTVNIIVSF